jgi:hypothetical protein
MGNFSEIINQVKLVENMAELSPDELLGFQLSGAGQLARDILLNDLQLMKNHGASPILNVIRAYERDERDSFFPTDVYSFHVDCSPIETDTFLCTYHGEPSEILPNLEAEQKILIPRIRHELKRKFPGTEMEFESYLKENFFDLHYQPIVNARPISLGVGNLWKLAVDHPQSQTIPCVHRAPMEKNGEKRLLLIC